MLTRKDPNARLKDQEELEEEERVKEALSYKADSIPDKYTMTKNCTFYMFWTIIIVLANVSTCILYPAHTILSYNKAHDGYDEP